MNKDILAGIALGIGLIGVVAWRVVVTQHNSVVHIVDVHDISRSHFQGCQVFEGLAQDAARSPGLSPKSTLTILITGDKNTANEPVAIAKYGDLKSTRAVEGKNADTTRVQTMLHDVEQKCVPLKPTERSPILLAVRQGLSMLHSSGCRVKSHCVLNIDTDGQENADKWLQNAINESSASPPSTLGKLDDDGVEVRFCGIASTAGQLFDGESRGVRSVTRNSVSDERLRLAWTRLFANPDHVSFAPFCTNGSSLLDDQKR
jgi:hypothetical protein